MPSPQNNVFRVLSFVLATAVVLSRKNCATGTPSKTKTFHVGGPGVLHREATLSEEDEQQAEKSAATEQPPWEEDPMPRTQPTRPQPIPKCYVWGLPQFFFSFSPMPKTINNRVKFRQTCQEGVNVGNLTIG